MSDDTIEAKASEKARLFVAVARLLDGVDPQTRNLIRMTTPRSHGGLELLTLMAKLISDDLKPWER